MEDRRVLVDTSIFIEYFRKENKKKTKLYRLRKQGYELMTSSVCYFEYKAGSKHEEFDKILFEKIAVVDFDKSQADVAASIYKELKKENKMIEFRDILISATAIFYSIPLITLNKKHFSRIRNLELLSLSE